MKWCDECFHRHSTKANCKPAKRRTGRKSKTTK